MRLSVVVCDTCEDPKRATSQYVITKDGASETKDLCAQHARPLEVILGNAKPTGRPPAKKTAAKRAAKKASATK